MSRNVTDSGKGKSWRRQITSQLVLNTSTKTYNFYWFRMGEELTKTENKQEFDICYSIDENIWNGMKSIQLRLKRYKVIS